MAEINVEKKNNIWPWIIGLLLLLLLLWGLAEMMDNDEPAQQIPAATEPAANVENNDAATTTPEQ